MIKNVCLNLVSFINGGSIGDEERAVKLFNFFNGGSIGDQELTCQTLQLLKRRDYLWSGTCLSNSPGSSVEAVLVIRKVSVKTSASLMEGVLVIKNVSVKLFSLFIGGSIGDEERVCQTLQLH